MRIHRTRPAALFCLGLLLTAAAALAGDVAKEPGYVDLEWIRIPDDADEIKDIDLSPMLMTFARDAKENGDDALVQALAMVRSLRVKAFSATVAMDPELSAAVEQLTAKLKKDQWKRLIYVKNEDETISVNTRYVDDELVGLMLVAYEPGDSVAFVNVVGDLDLATLLRLAGEIDSDNLEEMLEGIDDIEIEQKGEPKGG